MLPDSREDDIVLGSGVVGAHGSQEAQAFGQHAQRVRGERGARRQRGRLRRKRVQRRADRRVDMRDVLRVYRQNNQAARSSQRHPPL